MPRRVPLRQSARAKTSNRSISIPVAPQPPPPPPEEPYTVPATMDGASHTPVTQPAVAAFSAGKSAPSLCGLELACPTTPVSDTPSLIAQ